MSYGYNFKIEIRTFAKSLPTGTIYPTGAILYGIVKQLYQQLNTPKIQRLLPKKKQTLFLPSVRE